VPCRDRAAIALAILALGAGVAGCGSSANGVTSKSASEILAAARVAAQSASSVHVSAKSGVGRTTLTLDASLAKDKGHAQLSLLGIGFEAIRVGDTLYVKGNRIFDAHLERTLGVKVPSGTWLKGPASGALAQVGSFTDMKREVPLLLSSSVPATKGSETKVEGQPAIELKESAKLYTGILYVATTGNPYPIKLLKTGRETGQTTFSGWNDPVSVSAPANAVEIGQLKRKGR
jgi:hypothetical protein